MILPNSSQQFTVSRLIDRKLFSFCICASFMSSAIAPQAASAEKSALDRAVAQIRAEVDALATEPNKYSREFVAAVATMNFVQSEVSPLRYSMLVRNGKKLPTTADEYLATRAGICGGQVMTFRSILDRLKIRNRPVGFYLRGKTPAENHSHIGAEVFFDDQWHYFDVTWGTFFRTMSGRTDSVMSISDVLKTKNATKHAVTNQSDLWFQQWTTSGLDPLDYVTHQERDVVVGNGGTINIRPIKQTASSQIYSPIHQPNYIGRNNSSPDFGSLTTRLKDVDPKATHCIIKIAGKAGDGRLVITSKNHQHKIPFTKLKIGDLRVDLKSAANLSFSVETQEPRQIGYVVFSQIIIPTKD